MKSLKVFLSQKLPQLDGKYKIISFTTKPKKTHSLTVCKSGTNIVHDDDNKSGELTSRTKHFITILYDDIIFFAIEIYVYYSKDLRTIYVSKADTNGCEPSFSNKNNKISIKSITIAILEWLNSIPIEFYSRIIKQVGNDNKKDQLIESTTKDKLVKLAAQLKLKKDGYDIKNEKIINIDIGNNVKTRICLYARPEPQYLFPFSEENKKKHILPGDELIKWWLDVLDKTTNSSFVKDNNDKTKCLLEIPGGNDSDLKRYIKRSNLLNEWKHGSLFLNDSTKDKNAIYYIPNFPDDPKGRFVEHLVIEDRAKKTTTSRFWIELQVRQEFRLSNSVGIFGVEGKSLSSEKISEDDIKIYDDKLLISVRNEKILLDTLLGGDYSTANHARRYSLEFLKKIRKLKLDKFITEIKGDLKNVENPTTLKRVAEIQVMDLSNLVRKKKKVKKQPVNPVSNLNSK